MKLKIYTLLIVALVTTGNLLAQQNNTLYYMWKVPQAAEMNPAIQNNSTFYIGIGSSVYFDIHNNFLKYSDIVIPNTVPGSEYDYMTIFHPEAGDELDNWLDKLKDKNTFGNEVGLNVLNIGVKVQDMYFTFDVRHRTSMEFSLPGDFFRFATKLNGAFEGGVGDFSGIDVDMLSYNEYAVGFSKQDMFLPGLTLGARAKILKGVANVNIRNSTFDFTSTTDEIGFDASMEINTAGPLQMVYDVPNPESLDEIDFEFPESDEYADYGRGKGNGGFAIDLGATYQFDDRITFYGSILDLGWISWKTNPYNLKISGEYSFDGLTVDSLISTNSDISIDDLTEEELDKITESYATELTENKYSTGIGPKIYLGANYKVHEMLNVGVLSRSKFYNGQMRQQLTLSANTNVLPGLMYSVSYSMMNRTYNNIGMGLTFRLLPMQLFFVTDNVSNAWAAHKSRNVNFRFGMNWVFGFNHDRKKVDVPFLQD